MRRHHERYPAQASPAVSTAAGPSVQVTSVVSGLANPWDITYVGDLMLYDLRAGQVWSKPGNGAPQQVSIAGVPSIFAQGESGLLGMVADPGAVSNGRFYTRQAVTSNGSPVGGRVLRWRLTSDTTAVSDGAPVVTGLPLTSGRHSGCRLPFGPTASSTSARATQRRAPTRRTWPRSAARCCAWALTAPSPPTTRYRGG